METIKFIGLLAMTWLIVEGAEPIQFLKRVLKINSESTTTQTKWYRVIIIKLLACELCTGFWVGFIYYFYSGYESFILLACITSIASELFARVINFLFDYLFNQWKN